MPCYIELVDKSFQGLVLSLIIHGLLLWVLLTHPMPPLTRPETPTEITLIEKDKDRKKKQYFVTETEQDEIKDKIHDMAGQLSALTKRVKKQMVARETDPTQNRQQQLQLTPRPTEPITMNPTAKNENRPHPQQARGDGPSLPSPGGASLRQVAIGGSTIAEHIPGVDEGAFTALNTDQLTYYTFFARVNEQVRNRWVSMIRNYVDSLSQEQLAHLSRGDRQTVIEIVLNKAGEIVRALVLNSSTVKPLDAAAIESFKMAAPFLNPPLGLVEADGLIHLRYVFMVRFRPYFGPGGN